MSDILTWIFGSYANPDWWFMNKENIALGLLMAAGGGTVFALCHEATKALLWHLIKKHL